MQRGRIVVAALAAAVLAVRAASAFTLNGLFTGGAVLQQSAPIPVWGAAEPGEGVVVEFAG